jgi:trimeric autotransporter adhesin
LPVALSGSRTYEGTANAAYGILSVANKVGSDAVTVASGSGTLASANAGAQAITSFGTLALGGAAVGTVTVTFAGTPDAQYVVQASDSLASPAWENVSTNTAGTDGQWTFTESTEHHPARFYRSAKP